MKKIFFTLIMLCNILFAEDADQQGTPKQLFYGETSVNYITRWPFKECADHHFVPDVKALDLKSQMAQVIFDPLKVEAADIVYVEAPNLFFTYAHPRIKNPYILISHGDVDSCYKDEYTNFLNDKKIIAWFGIHPGVNPHPKFFPLPIGLIALQSFNNRKEKMNEFFMRSRNEVIKDKLLCINFLTSSYPERKAILKLFEDRPFCYRTQPGTNTEIYLEEMSHCKFTLSPRGIAIDCFRTWEALLVGSIPIVQSSQLDVLYKDLPVLIIKNWRQVTEEFLNQKYKEITAKKYNIEKLYFEYWHKQILNIKQGFLKNYHARGKNKEVKKIFSSSLLVNKYLSRINNQL